MKPNDKSTIRQLLELYSTAILDHSQKPR